MVRDTAPVLPAPVQLATVQGVASFAVTGGPASHGVCVSPRWHGQVRREDDAAVPRQQLFVRQRLLLHLGAS